MNSTFTNPFIIALNAVITQLTRLNVQYMVFGGVANSLFGDPRLTFDIDIKVVLESELTTRRFISIVEEIGKVLVDDPEQFIADTHVLPALVAEVRIDFVIAELPFEKEAVERGNLIHVYGVDLRVCTPEDFIIHKAVSTRQKDWLDIGHLIRRRREELDWDYLLKHCSELAEFMGRPDLLKKIRAVRDERG